MEWSFTHRLSIGAINLRRREIHSTMNACHRCHYDVLGVDKKATIREIKRAYFDKSKLYHPDRDRGETEKFVELKNAYDTLRRPADRRAYDNFLAGVPPAGRRRQYNNNNYGSQDWEAYWKSQYGENFSERQSTREMYQNQMRYSNSIAYFISLGLTLVAFYNVGLWYSSYKYNQSLEKLVAKDEIARSFLRQREFQSSRADPLEIDYYARLLKTDIDEARRTREEERRLTNQKNPFEIREESRWMEAVTQPGHR